MPSPARSAQTSAELFVELASSFMVARVTAGKPFERDSPIEGQSTLPTGARS